MEARSKGRAASPGTIERWLSQVGLQPDLVVYALALFALSRALFVAATLVALRFLHTIPYHAPVPTFLQAWARWDAAHYAWLATNGYQPGKALVHSAFFPLQPLAMHLVAPLVAGNVDIAGMVVSNVSFIVALLGLAALAAHDFDAEVARRAMLYLTLFPTALFFFTGYAESLFLACAIWCVFALRRGWWWQAGMLGLLATLTRQMGLFLVLPFAYSYAQHAEWRLRAVRADALWGLLIPSGLILFMAWLWLRVGDPLAFVHVEPQWSHVLSPPWTTLWQGIEGLVRNPDPIGVRKGLVDLGAVLLFAVLIALGVRRQQTGDVAYSASVWLLATSYPTTVWWLQSDARYMLAAFPCFVLLAWLGHNRWVHVVILVISVGTLLMLTQYFVRGAVIV